MPPKFALTLMFVVALGLGGILAWNAPATWIDKTLSAKIRPGLKAFGEKTGAECQVIGPDLGHHFFLNHETRVEILCIDPDFQLPPATVGAVEDSAFTREFRRRHEPLLQDLFSVPVDIGFLPHPQKFPGAPLSCFLSGEGWRACPHRTGGGCRAQSCAERLNSEH